MFKGLGVAMVTPFQANGEIHFKGLEKLTNHLVEKDVDYLVVMGTTGESATLDHGEKVKVLEFVKEVNNNRKPIVLGVGGNNTRAVQDSFLKFNLNDVSGILSVSPYYNKPTQNGIYQHYKAVASETDLPIILYNVPGRTSSNILPETTLRLANDISNIVAVKEASGDLEQIMDIIQNKPKDFTVISGDDALTLPILASGGDGVISVVGNAFPKRFGTMVHAALQEDMSEARKWHYLLLKLIPMLFKEGNPAGVKETLKHLNICENHVRLPLVSVSSQLSKEIYNLLAENELLEW